MTQGPPSLFTRLCAGDFAPPAPIADDAYARILRGLPPPHEAVVLLADAAAAEFGRRVPGTVAPPAGWTLAAHVPAPRPIAPIMFIEAAVAPDPRSLFKLPESARWGIIVGEIKLDPSLDGVALYRDAAVSMGVRHLLRIDLFVEYFGVVRGPVFGIIIGLDPDGAPIDAGHELEYYGMGTPHVRDGLAVRSRVLGCLFALSLANCRNVELVPYTLPRAMRRRHDGPAHAQYYTLNIEPILRRRERPLEARSDQEHAALALHLCRGHFKDYRAGGGLFGRNKGLFWWNLHARGTAERGVVVKDYAAPSPGTA